MSNSPPASPDQEPGRPAQPEAHPMPSRGRRVALVVTATALLLWIGYLAFLAYTASRPIVLSGPQILASNLIIIAQLTGNVDHPDQAATVVEVVWAGDQAVEPAAKAKITVGDLKEIYAADAGAGQPNRCWRGAGQYILPLTSAGKGAFRITLIPSSPGYPPPRRPGHPPPEADRLRIYPVTPNTREELQRILREYQRQ